MAGVMIPEKTKEDLQTENARLREEKKELEKQLDLKNRQAELLEKKHYPGK